MTAIVYVPVSIPASWLIDKLGIRRAVGAGAVLAGAFGLLRSDPLHLDLHQMASSSSLNLITAIHGERRPPLRISASYALNE